MIDIDVDLRGSLLPVRDQKDRPTCLAFAASAAHEMRRSSTGFLSPEYLYHFAKDGPDLGCTFPSMSRVLGSEGQPVEADCPQLLTEPNRSWKPQSGLTVFRRDSIFAAAATAHLFTAIRSGQTPVLGIRVVDAFFRPAAPWVLSAAGRERGLHALVGAGIGCYNGMPVVLIRNSWGKSWADQGYAWLDEAFLNQHLVAVMDLTGDLT
jgi:hypothetical protein